MRILEGNHAPRSPSQEGPEAERKSLLAMLHIAKKDMGWTDEFYRSLLETCFGVSTSAALSNLQLRALMASIRNRGWKPKRKPGEPEEQVLAFQTRIKVIASQIPDGNERLRGLCKSICGVPSVGWCRDVAKMKRLLAILGNILRQERERSTVAGGS
jgi:hypothetical protein